jgi:V/A-type H+/Na+-transporting ATPase subunit I
VIRRMRRVRILGPRARMEQTLDVLQDLGSIHLVAPPGGPALSRSARSARAHRLSRDLATLAADAERAQTLLGAGDVDRAPPPDRPPWPEWARWARRLRRQVERLETRKQALEQEQALLGKYREMLTAFAGLFDPGALPGTVRAYHVLLRPGHGRVVEPLREALTRSIGGEFGLRTRVLAAGDTAVLLIVPPARAARVEELLHDSGVTEVSLPAGYEQSSAVEALPRMRARLEEVPRLQGQLEEQRRALAMASGAQLATVIAATHDALTRLEASGSLASTRNAFVLEGWVPAPEIPALARALQLRVGPELSLEQLQGGPDWADAPVVLHNPRLFRPFQIIVEKMPLPSYGSIDPTPFVAVFFPVFFGLMLGDIGYGLVLALLGGILFRRSAPGSTTRAVAQIALICAIFTVIFGALFGELFGDLGRRWFGLHALVLDREEPRDIVSFLVLCVGLGGVHVLLGLVLGVLNALHGHRRQAIGRGLTALMVLLVIAALLAAVRLLPHALLTPAVIALLVAFPILIVIEGIVAPVELLATLGNILSYARIMALGTASVMLAVVANRLAGAMGSVVVGAVLGLLFHLVNFALGLFSPAIHALRLHYVEFFGRFYSPGGVPYRPFGHWRTP